MLRLYNTKIREYNSLRVDDIDGEISFATISDKLFQNQARSLVKTYLTKVISATNTTPKGTDSLTRKQTVEYMCKSNLFKG